MPGLPGTEASPATRPDECGAGAPRSPARYSLRRRFRHLVRSGQAVATVAARSTRESSGSAIFHRGSGSGSRPRRGKSTRETHPTWVRRSMFRPPATRPPAWRSSVRIGKRRSSAVPYLVLWGRRFRRGRINIEPFMKKLAAEFFGTFSLVFAGTGAIIINDVAGGAVSHVGIALTFGLVVLAMIYALGDVSGAHLNPAVTLAFVAARRLEWRWAAPYVASQTLGAITASLLLRGMFPQHPTLGATSPTGTGMQSFILEIVLTLVLMFVILSVSTGAKEKGITAGIAIGSIIGLEALFAGPISGASMNPARSLAPALVSLHVEHVWIYLAAPVIGACLAVPLCQCIHPAGCCSK